MIDLFGYHRIALQIQLFTDS